MEVITQKDDDWKFWRIVGFLGLGVRWITSRIIIMEHWSKEKNLKHSQRWTNIQQRKEVNMIQNGWMSKNYAEPEKPDGKDCRADNWIY